MAQLSLKGLTKRFDKVEAVCGVDLDVAHEEFVVLVGPSGCGKSTILRMIAGLEEATAGEIRIGDRVVNNLSPRDRDIAMVFQNYALYPHKTVHGNMAFALRAKGLPKAQVEERVAEAAAVLGLTDLLERKPGEIKKLHRRLRATTVYVTHDQVEAMTLADRIVILNKGKVEQVGSPTDVYATPANLFVAGFIGSPAMNMLPAGVAAGHGIACAAATNATFGIRPEDIALLPPGTQAPAVIEAEVTMVEPLGAEFLLSFALDGHEITAKIPGRALPRIGERLRFAFDTRHAHVFDHATGRRV